MHLMSCPSIVFRQPSIHKCPFVCQHMKCRHSDGEVPFGLITMPFCKLLGNGDVNLNLSTMKINLISTGVIKPNGTSPFECRHFICWNTKGHLWIEGFLNTIDGHDMSCIHYPTSFPFYLFICWLLYATLSTATHMRTWLSPQHPTYYTRVSPLQPMYRSIHGFPL